MKRLVFFLIIITLAGCAFLPCAERGRESFRVCEIVGVHDGDTFTARLAHFPDVQKIRLIGIDAPELASGQQQKFSEPHTKAQSAREYLSNLLYGADEIEVTPRRNLDGSFRRSFGRLVAFIDVDGKDAGAAMLSAGLACLPDARYRNHPRADKYLNTFQTASEARLKNGVACDE